MAAVNASILQVEQSRRRSSSSLSGGVMMSLLTEYRSQPPSFWAPRPSTLPPQDASDNPVYFSVGAAVRARAVQQTLMDPGPHPNEQPSTPPHARSRAYHSVPPTPTSDNTVSPSWSRTRSASSPTDGRSTGHLNASAHVFVPGRPVEPIPEVDLNEFMKQEVKLYHSSPKQLCRTPPPVENRTLSDEEDAEIQWREQMRLQVEDIASVLKSTHSTPRTGISELMQGEDKVLSKSQRWSTSESLLAVLQGPPESTASQAKVLQGNDMTAVTKLNRVVTKACLFYDRDFLLQFKDICTEPPAPLQAVAESLSIHRFPTCQRSPLGKSPTLKGRRKWRDSALARNAGVTFGTLDPVAGSDDVRIAPSALPPSAVDHGAPQRRTESVASDRDPAPYSPTVVSTASESGSPTSTLGGCIETKLARCDSREKYKETRLEELETKVASLMAEVEALRLEVTRLQSYHTAW